MINFDLFKTRRLAVYLIGVPMAIALVYYALVALDRYASVAQIAVRQAGSPEAPELPGLAVLLGGTNPTSREETLYLREFITSSDMLAKLERDLEWSRHYSGHWRDPIYWLAKDTSKEDLLDYYRRVVSAHFDEETGLLTVEVQAFDRGFAQEVLKTILSESERFVNELSHRMAREQMKFAQTELASARKAYEERRNAMLEFQSKNNVLDAQAAAQARAGVISELEAQLTKERANLKGMQATLNANSPQVRQQLVRIKALEQQISAEENRLVSNSNDGRLNVIAARYHNLTIDAGIAEEAYKFAVSAVETARIEASKKIRSLAIVVSPNEPEEAIYPRRIYNLITIFIALLLIYGIARFIIATIEDHRD